MGRSSILDRRVVLPSSTRGHGAGLSVETKASVRGECVEDEWLPCYGKNYIVLVFSGQGGTGVRELHSFDFRQPG